MKKMLIFCTTFALLVGLCAGIMVASLVRNSPTAHANGTITVHVIDHAITDTEQEWHPPKESLGDILAFHNPVYNASDKVQVGHVNGNCTRTAMGSKGEWECFATTLLSGGNITVEGAFYDDNQDSTLTITGGTGIYVGAEGSMLLHARGHPLGSEYDFIFTIEE